MIASVSGMAGLIVSIGTSSTKTGVSAFVTMNWRKTMNEIGEYGQRGEAMSSDRSQPMTDGDRVVAALKAAYDQAERNSNLGQLGPYRLNHLIVLIEHVRMEAWKAAVQRCTTEVTLIWGADLVTTQAALDELVKCTPPAGRGDG